VASDKSAEIQRLLDFLVALRKLQKRLDGEVQDDSTWWHKFSYLLDTLGSECNYVEECAEKVGREFCMEEMVELLQAIDALPKGGPDESRQG
jgi:hypothetical protein